METSPVRGGGTEAAPATSPNYGNHPLAPFAESSPRRSKRQRAKKGADDKGMKQLDLRQMQQRSPTKATRAAAAAAAVGSAAGAEQQPIVIRDDVDMKTTTTAALKKKTLRAAREKTGGDDEAMPACASSDQVGTALGGQGDGDAVKAPSATLGEEKEDLRQTPVAETTVAAAAAAAGATAVAGMAGWIMRPGARKAAAAAEAPKAKAPRKTRARPARDAAKGEVAAAAAQPAQLPATVADGAAAVDPNNAGSGAAPVPKKQRSRRNVKKALIASESVLAPSQATSATTEFASAMPSPTAEQPPEETATSASTGGETPNARGRGRGKARQPRRAKATRNDEAEEETSSDLTTPTSSQDDEQQSSPLQRRSGRLQVKRDAALDKIREQEALLRTAALEQQRQQQIRDAEQSPARGGGGSGSEGSEGHSSPGEQGWMWKSSAAAGRTRTKRGGSGSKAEGEEVRLASVKPRRRLPIAALPFTTDLPEAPAGQEKLMLRLKVPPSLQLEMRSLGESKTQSAPASPAGGSRLRATKRSKRKRAGGSDDSGGEDGSYSANEATRSTTAGNDNEPRRKRRRRVDAEKDLPQPAATGAKPRGRKKAKDEVSEVEPQPVVVGGGGGEEFFMTKEQREAHRQARMKEKLKKRTEESKKVDLKLTHGKEAHPFLMPRKAPASTSSSSGTNSSSSSSSSLSTSSSVAFLPLPPPVPSHVTQLTAREEAFLASFGPATSAFLPPVGMHSTHSDAPAGPLFEGMRGMDQLRARTIRAAEEQRTKSDVRVLTSAGGLETEPCVDDAAMVVQVLDAIHALFPSTATTDHGCERAAEAQHLLAAYRWKHDNAGGMTTSSESAAACRQLWTEKYRPRCARDVIDHGPGMATLAGWLARWKKSATTKTTKTKKTGRRRAKSDEDDGDGTVRKANLLLLQGHTGIGKTAAVYACAEEYGFRVLEINPTVERTGAHIKNLVEEATQSRNVASLSSASAVAPTGGDSISLSPPTSQGEAARCSLVLFEEVDVVFGTDKGFFSALRELLRIAKTPVVLTCNAVTDEVADLLRDVSPHIDLRFGPVRHAELLLHLQLVCLAEGLRCADVVAQTNDVKQLVEHVGGDVRRSLLALQFWLQNGGGGGGGGGFDYLSWLGPGDVAAHGGHDSLASLLLAGTTDERLRWAAQMPMSMTSLLHCNLFSFFPRVGAQPELAPVAPACLLVDSGMVSTTTTTTTTTAEAAPAQSAVAAVSRDKALALVPMMDGLDFLCDVLSFNDAASTERRKRKTLVHHGVDITPDAMLGREVEAATAVLGLACLPAAFSEEHVEELAIPHKHNKQLTLREAHRAGYAAVYGEVVPRVLHVSRYGGIDCFGMVQHIALLDALNHQAKEGRRKRRHVNCLGLEAGQHAWLMRHAFPLVPPSLVDPIHQRDRLRAQAAGEGADDGGGDDAIQPPPTPANDAIPDQGDEEAEGGEEGGKCEEGEQDDGVDGVEPSSSQVEEEEATEEPSPSPSQSQVGVREEECSSQFVSMEEEAAAYEEDEDESEREDESETKEGGEEKQDSSADVL